jgi:hypothetical protein
LRNASISGDCADAPNGVPAIHTASNSLRRALAEKQRYEQNREELVRDSFISGDGEPTS